MKLPLLLIFICIIPIILKAQNSNLGELENENEEIVQRSFVLTSLTSENILENSLINNLVVPANYFQISVPVNVLPIHDETHSSDQYSEIFTEGTINSLLNENQLGQQILSAWFCRQSDGRFDLDSIGKIENLNREEIENIVQDQAKHFSFDNNKSLKKINETYVIVVDFITLKTMQEYYDQTGVEEEYRILNGYMSTFKYYLLKFDFNTSVAKRFFKDFWVDENTEVTDEKLKLFENAEFPFSLVYTGNGEIAATQHNPGNQMAAEVQKSKEELLDDLVELTVENIMKNVQNDSIYYKNNRVLVADPVAVSMGRENNVKFDRRYLVLENQIGKDGHLKLKRVGVVRSMRISYDQPKKNSEANMSLFYQIGGKKIDVYGMYLKKKGSVGINLYYGKSVSGVQNNLVRFEYYFSKLLDGTIETGKLAKGLTSVKIYFEGGLNKASYLWEENPENFKFVRGVIGINKDFYPVRNVHWGPFVGYGVEYTTWEGSEELISTNFVETGARVGINIFHNLQVVGSLNKYLLIHSVLMDADRNVTNDKFNYNKVFSDRKGISLSVGLRLML